MAAKNVISSKGRGKQKRPPIVEVLWVDATGWGGWRHQDEKTGLTPVSSVGYLLKSDKDEIVIYQSDNPSCSETGGQFHIPKPWIKKVIRK